MTVTVGTNEQQLESPLESPLDSALESAELDARILSGPIEVAADSEAAELVRTAPLPVIGTGALVGPNTWKQDRVVYRRVAAASDLTLVSIAAFLFERQHVWNGGFAPVVALCVGLFFVVIVGLYHGYDSRRAATGIHEFRALGRGFLALSLAMLILDFFNLTELHPGTTVLGLTATAAATLSARAIQRRIALASRRKGRLRRRTLVVANHDSVSDVLHGLDGDLNGFDIVGLCLPEAHIVGTASSGGVPIWGDLSGISDLIKKHRIDAVVIASGVLDVNGMRQFRWALEDLQAELLIAPNLNEVQPDRVELRTLSTMPLLTVTTGPSRLQRILKDMGDRALALCLLIAISPIIGAAALAVRLTSPGAVIFRQKRIGLHGKPFTMYKLRSMVTDAEELKAALADEGNKGGGALFKLADDPRVTPVGRIMRRFSIDELPQIWNVLRGDMSLVGPRPALPSEVQAYDEMAARRLHVKPGLTGLWQVSGRADLSWEESVRLDLRYVDNFSLTRDLQILARTARAVFGASGAY